MIHLLFYTLNRFFSGAKNGAWYAGKEDMHNIWTLCMILCTVIYPFFVAEHWWQVGLVVMPVMVFIGMWEMGMERYLHLWESVGATVFMGYGILLGADLLMYPLTGMLVNILAFKGPINYYIGRDWIEANDGTDDESGKTLGFPTPWGFFKRPRVSNGWVAVGLGMVLILAWLLLPRINIWDLI